MKYYHGTDRYFKDLRLPIEKSYKDFGVGVYLAEKELHAVTVAFWKAGKHAYLYEYYVNMKDISKRFNIKVFRGESIEWVKYIIENRTNFLGNDYDAVIGPTADASAQKLVQKFIEEYKYKAPTLGDYRKLQKALQYKIIKDSDKDKFGNQICIKSQELLDIFNKSKVKETKLR